RYASSGPSSPSYASCEISSVNGSVNRAIRKGPASTGSNPTSRISSAAIFLLLASSPQYMRLGLLALRRASKTPNSTSLGTVLKAETTRAFGNRFASASAPEDVWAITRSVSSAFIGSEQLTMTLPDTSPACFNTSSIRDQCTASKSAAASRAASPGVPARAFPDRQAERWRETAYADPGQYLRRRAELVVSLGMPLVPGDMLLDLACGDGALAEALLPHGLNYVGVDASKPMVAAARRRLGSRASVELADLNEFRPLQPGAATTRFPASYHARDRRSFLRRVAGYTKKKFVFDVNPRREPLTA